MSLSPEELQLVRAHVAVHEAGHAVAALEQGMTVARVSMTGEGDPGEGTVAFVSFGERPAYELMAERPDAMGPVLLAGTSAERYFFNGAHVMEGYARDIAVIQSHTGPSPDLEHAMAMLQPWVNRAREIVRERRVAIETVAAALMTVVGLTREELVELVARSESEPVLLLGALTPHWRLPEGGTEG